MAAVAKKAGSDAKQFNYAWTGKDKAGKVVRGELRAGGDSIVAAQLRRQGIQVTSVKKVRQKGGKSITEKDITIFTRQLAVMMKAGVPLLQAFDIVGRGHANPSVGKLLLDVASTESFPMAVRDLSQAIGCNWRHRPAARHNSRGVHRARVRTAVNRRDGLRSKALAEALGLRAPVLG